MGKAKKGKVNSPHLVYLKAIAQIAFLGLLLLLSLINIITYLKSNNLQAETAKSTINLSEKINYWNSFMKIYPTYKQGWVELSKLETLNGNYANAKIYLERSKKLDPNNFKSLLEN